MRFILSLFVVLCFVFLPSALYAEDGFGARFTNATPSAFGDPVDGAVADAEVLDMDEAAQLFQDIMPAAGGEGAVEDALEETVETQPEAASTPAEPGDIVEQSGK